MAGSFTQFTRGAAVVSVSLATDFSAVLLPGLSPQSDRSSIAAIVHDIDQWMSHVDIRLVPQSSEITKSAHVTFPDLGFTKTFITKLNSSQQRKHLNTETEAFCTGFA